MGGRGKQNRHAPGTVPDPPRAPMEDDYFCDGY